MTVPMIHQGEDGYEHARRDAVWNARVPDRSPAAIVAVRDEADVVSALALARRRGWRVTVRSGGHNFVGNALRDGSLLLDLARLRDIQVDVAGRTATVEPGADNERLIELLSGHGLTFSVGHCPSVCMGGFLLGGGLGFNTGEHGYAAESVVGVDLITADGERLHASATENPDLFWAVRGAGPGFFAVVTRYHLSLSAHPNGLWSSSITLPLDLLERATRWLDDITPSLDPRVEPMGWIGSLHGHEIGAGQAEAHAGEPVFLLNSLVYADSDDEARRLLRPLAEPPFAEAVLSRTEVKTSFPELFDFQRLLYKKGRRYAVDCHWTDVPPDRQPLDHLRKQLRHVPSARTHVLWQLPFGNYQKTQPDMAVSILGRYFVSIYAVWEHAADDEKNIAWLRDTLEPFEAISTGHYAGDVDLTARPARAQRTLSARHWERYLELKSRYDPDELFHRHAGPDGVAGP